MILAIGTFQRASCEKDGPRTIFAGDGRLFAKMRAYVGNPERVSFAAETSMCINAISNPVHPALARAENAIFVRFYQIHPDHWSKSSGFGVIRSRLASCNIFSNSGTLLDGI